MAKDMKVKILYLTKINMGDYNAQHLGIEIDATVKDVGEADLLWEEARQSIEKQAAPFLAIREVPSVGVPLIPDAPLFPDIDEPPEYRDIDDAPPDAQHESWPADECKIIHALTKSGGDAVKILNKTRKVDVYMFGGKGSVLAATPMLDKWKDWPISEFVDGKGFVENVFSLPKEITSVVVNTTGKYPEIVALR